MFMIGSMNAAFSAYASPRQTLDFNVVGGIDAMNYNGKIIAPASLYFEPADQLPGSIVANRTTSTQANLNASGVHKWTMDKFTATTSFGMRKERRYADQLYDQAKNVPGGAQNVVLSGQQATSESINLVKDHAYYAQE